MSLFPTKFVADVGTVTFGSSETVEGQLTVGGTVILKETYSPANGNITIRGLRTVLEAAIYGDLMDVSHAKAAVSFTAGSYSESKTLYASRLRDPNANDSRTILVAGDLVGVVDEKHELDFMTGAVIYTSTAGLNYISADQVSDGEVIGDNIRIWIDRTTCPERAACVRFLNRYDVPQTMMTTRPIDVKPGFQDQTSLMYGQRVRYSVEQQDEYTIRSGRIHSMEEYASWADLVTARKAEVWWKGRWIPIIVTKSNFTAVRRSMGMPPVEISFRPADPRQAM